MLTFIISVLGVNTLTQFYKKTILRYGPNTIHIAAGIISLAGALIFKMFGTTQIFQSVMGNAIAVFASAITLHQVLWKKLASAGITDADLSS